MTRRRVADDKYGELWRRASELVRRVDEGTLPFDPVMDALQEAIMGRFTTTPSGLLVVDYSIRPSLVSLEVIEHPTRTDTITLNPRDIKLVRTLREGETSVHGEENLRRLEATTNVVLDVRVMEELWKHKELIPEEWKNVGAVYFWATRFRDEDDRRYVACLCWNGERWRWRFYWLEDLWYSDEPAACLASASA